MRRLVIVMIKRRPVLLEGRRREIFFDEKVREEVEMEGGEGGAEGVAG
jgi:hypothetical protein